MLSRDSWKRFGHGFSFFFFFVLYFVRVIDKPLYEKILAFTDNKEEFIMLKKIITILSGMLMSTTIGAMNVMKVGEDIRQDATIRKALCEEYLAENGYIEITEDGKIVKLRDVYYQDVASFSRPDIFFINVYFDDAYYPSIIDVIYY